MYTNKCILYVSTYRSLLFLDYQNRVEDLSNEGLVGAFQVGRAIKHGKFFVLFDNEGGRSTAIQVDGLFSTKVLHGTGQIHNGSAIGKPRKTFIYNQNDGGTIFADAYARQVKEKASQGDTSAISPSRSMISRPPKAHSSWPFNSGFSAKLEMTGLPERSIPKNVHIE